MTDPNKAPERIWALPPAWKLRPVAGTWYDSIPDNYEAFMVNNPVEYVRADLSLPAELVEKASGWLAYFEKGNWAYGESPFGKYEWTEQELVEFLSALASVERKS